MSSEFYSSCPTYTENAYLCRWVDGDIPGSRRLARWHQEILWVCESHSQIKTYINGIEVSDSSTVYDYYGWLTSITEQIKEAQYDTEHYGIALGNPCLVEVAVISWVERRAGKFIEHKEGCRAQYEQIEFKGCMTGTDEEFDRFQKFDWNAPCVKGEWSPSDMKDISKESPRIKVWSSLNPCSEEWAKEQFLAAMPVEFCGSGDQ